jgi:catechol 2,3-dioxygenase-like lactoylglutathione lyase family enzyme
MARLAALLALIPFVVRAQSATEVAGPAAFRATGGFFAVSVADLDTSARWYTEKLGMTVVRRMPNAGQSSVAILAGGGLVVELVHNDSARAAATAPAMSHGIFKAGVIVDGLQKTIDLLRSRGVEIAYGPFPARPGAMANCIIRDNAGNLIQLFER